MLLLPVKGDMFSETHKGNLKSKEDLDVSGPHLRHPLGPDHSVCLVPWRVDSGTMRSELCL